MLFLHREKRRVDHYRSPDCAGFYPERSEYLGEVMASSVFPKKRQGFMSPLKSFMYSTSNGFNTTKHNNNELPAVLHPINAEPVEGFSHTRFRNFHKFHTRASEFLLHSTNQKLAGGVNSPILSKLRAVNPQRIK
jgi:hypothetical protein